MYLLVLAIHELQIIKSIIQSKLFHLTYFIKYKISDVIHHVHA